MLVMTFSVLLWPLCLSCFRKEINTLKKIDVWYSVFQIRPTKCSIGDFEWTSTRPVHLLSRNYASIRSTNKCSPTTDCARENVVVRPIVLITLILSVFTSILNLLYRGWDWITAVIMTEVKEDDLHWIQLRGRSKVSVMQIRHGKHRCV